MRSENESEYEEDQDSEEAEWSVNSDDEFQNCLSDLEISAYDF